MPPKPPDTKPDLSASMRMASLVWQSVTEVAAGVLFGWLLDEIFDTDRIFLLIFGLLGIGVGMTTFIRVALKGSRRQAKLASQARYTPSQDPPEDEDDSP